MAKLLKKPKDLRWFYHPSLNIPERGMTGFYRPGGLDPITKQPLIEIVFKIPKD